MSTRLIRSLALAALLLTVTACNFPASPTNPPPARTSPPITYMLSVPTTPPTASASPLPVLTATTPPTATLAPVPTMPYADAGPVLAGVCYGYLQTLNGQTILLNSASDLTAFYNQVDRSKRCADAVSRQPFDFTASQIVGTVITGQGCGLDVAYDHIEGGGASGKQTIVVKAQIKGDCPYDLVRPVWLVVARSANIAGISVISTP